MVGVSALRFGFVVSDFGLSGFGAAVRLRPEEELPSSLSANFVTFLNEPGDIAVVIQRQHVGEETGAILGENIIL